MNIPNADERIRQLDHALARAEAERDTWQQLCTAQVRPLVEDNAEPRIERDDLRQQLREVES